jgi:hypothetical protein
MSKQLIAHKPQISPHHQQVMKVSPLVLCDRLIQVAQEAESAGFVQTAAHLVTLVDRMFDAPTNQH